MLFRCVSAFSYSACVLLEGESQDTDLLVGDGVEEALHDPLGEPQPGGGMEVTVLRLMSLIRNLPVPNCTNCGEKECNKGKVVEIINKLTKGSINPKLYTVEHKDLIITVISSRPQYILGRRSSDNQEVEFNLMHEGHPRFCYKCD